MRTNDPLAEFFRTRRSKLQPDDVGLPQGSRRRVKGLRREEVAMLAGISTDYYHRIEQGREKPSHQVLDALARALHLSPDATRYMRNLAQRSTFADRLAKQNRPLNPAVQHLIDGWPLAAAHIHDVTLTVVSANPLAAALTSNFGLGANPCRSLFLDPEMRSFYRSWDTLAAWAVRWLRAFAGDHHDPGLRALIDELISGSPEFERLWACYDIKGSGSGLLLIDHPVVGPLDLHFQHLALRGSEHILVVYWADPGSPSEDALRRLADAAGS